MRWLGIRCGGEASPRTFAFAAPLAAALLTIISPDGARSQPFAPSRTLVDAPTAGTNTAGTFETRTRAFPGGGLEVRVDVGLAHWLSLGGSYGGQQIIGDGDPSWNPEPGFSVKLRVIQEDYVLPALALGLDTQGSGYWDRERDRYQYQSRGLYAVLSKNYAWYGDLTFHGGLNRSFEGDDGSVNPFLGGEKSLGRYLGIVLEYDTALNDNRDDGAYGKGNGYLNTAIRWNLSPEIQVRLVVRDMLKNAESVDPARRDVILDEGFGREFTFSYVETF